MEFKFLEECILQMDVLLQQGQLLHMILNHTACMQAFQRVL